MSSFFSFGHGLTGCVRQKPRRNSCYGEPRRYVRNHNRISTYGYLIANVYSSQEFCTRSNRDITSDMRPDFRMEAHVQRFRSQGHTLKNGRIVPDFGGAYYRTSCVREEQTWANFTLRCDFNPKHYNIQVCEEFR